ncbi:MAG TPA: cytochrome c oxidase subunit II [Acidimicrobiia bacterium]|nr:cytochrome c oxidase subunit II [Acidimicrobiia bacterium]
MKSFKRYALLIGATAALTLVVAFALFGSPSADAQPAGPNTPAQPANGSAPPPVTQPDKRTGSQTPTTTTPGGAGVPTPAAPTATWYEELANKEVEEEGTFWMPKSVNLIADDSDKMFYAVLALSAFFFFAIAGAVVYLVVKYRHRPGHKPEPSAAHNDALEITWTVIPTIITVFLFYYGWRTYIRVVTPPTKAVEISVVAKRWAWNFTHQNGVEDSDLHVPVNTPIRLVMTSQDVLHSFYAPVMRVKQDLVPRRYTYAWFYPTKPGTYRLTCAEYCGTDHSQMSRLPDKLDAKGHLIKKGRLAVLVVHKPGDYERYLADKFAESGGGDPVDNGRKIYERKGCVSCHALDGTVKVGPSFKGSWGTTIQTAQGPVTFDENYIRESVMTPNAKYRAGFPVGTMPSFEGQLKDRDIEALAAWMKTLK